MKTTNAPSAPGGPTDELIGGNVARLRGETPQKALAECMRERGHKWSQATVWSVERGDRPLRLTEATSLSEILGVSLGELVYDPGADEQRARLLEAARKRHTALTQMVQAQDAAQEALSSWREAVDNYLQANGPERLQTVLADTRPGGQSSEDKLRPDVLLHLAEGLLVGELKNSERLSGDFGSQNYGR